MDSKKLENLVEKITVEKLEERIAPDSKLEAIFQCETTDGTWNFETNQCDRIYYIIAKP